MSTKWWRLTISNRNSGVAIFSGIFRVVNNKINVFYNATNTSRNILLAEGISVSGKIIMGEEKTNSTDNVFLLGNNVTWSENHLSFNGFNISSIPGLNTSATEWNIWQSGNPKLSYKVGNTWTEFSEFLFTFTFTETSDPTSSASSVAVSNICFPANTPVETNQGIVPIEKLNSEIHTINNKPVLFVTKTVSFDKYLVCFEKDSLGKNYPVSKTITSKDHKICYKGKMIEAYKFCGHFETVKKIEYTGEVLYNVLMEDYSTMKVNNLICETLHPNNIIAKLYTSNVAEDLKNQLIIDLNEGIRSNNFGLYKKAVNRLNSFKINKKPVSKR
jgi:hypothetical protein